MTAPVIGVSTGRSPASGPYSAALIETPESYLNALRAAGGVPLLLPVGLGVEELRTALQRLDGVLLIGGSDLDPALYNGRPHERVYGVDPRRDALDLSLVRFAADQNLPFLGICRGHQVVNVALGGTLYSDIGDQLQGALRHDWYPDIPRNTLAHEVAVEPGSRLANILGGERVGVNSLHHQGVERPAPGLRATAWAPDGLVEALELPGHPFGISVQWHPEWMQEHQAQRGIFKALVEACRNA